LSGGRAVRPTSHARVRLLPASLLAAALLCSCASRRRSAPPLPPRLPEVYSAILRLEAGTRERTLLLSAGVAVDRGGGARIEVRDPLGSTRFLVLLNREGGLAVDLGRNTRSLWRGASGSFPWAPSDWLALLAGPGGGALKWTPTASGGMKAAWRNGVGRIRAVWTPQGEDGATVEVKGPRGARLVLRWTRIRPADPPGGFLDPPDLELRDVGWETWLREAAP